MTISPAARRGLKTCSTIWARAAWYKSVSVRGCISTFFKSWITSRICSPMDVPPGSRVGKTSWPCSRRYSTSGGSWDVLPEPSGPSSVMNIRSLPHHQVAASQQQRHASQSPGIHLMDRYIEQPKVVHDESDGQ